MHSTQTARRSTCTIPKRPLRARAAHQYATPTVPLRHDTPNSHAYLNRAPRRPHGREATCAGPHGVPNRNSNPHSPQRLTHITRILRKWHSTASARSQSEMCGPRGAQIRNSNHLSSPRHAHFPCTPRKRTPQHPHGRKATCAGPHGVPIRNSKPPPSVMTRPLRMLNAQACVAAPARTVAKRPVWAHAHQYPTPTITAHDGTPASYEKHAVVLWASARSRRDLCGPVRANMVCTPPPVQTTRTRQRVARRLIRTVATRPVRVGAHHPRRRNSEDYNKTKTFISQAPVTITPLFGVSRPAAQPQFRRLRHIRQPPPHSVA